MPDRALVREDFLDIATMWRIQKEMGLGLEHIDVRCSAVEKPDAQPGSPDAMAGPGFLCDCGAVTKEWEVRVQQQVQAREQSLMGTTLYELWDGDSGNRLGTYESEQDALSSIASIIRDFGRASTEARSLGLMGPRGLVAEGSVLLDRAELAT